MRILVVFASKYGFTEKAAEKLRDELVAGKHGVTLVNLGKEEPPGIEGFDALLSAVPFMRIHPPGSAEVFPGKPGGFNREEIGHFYL